MATWRRSICRASRLKGIDMKAAEFLIGQDGQNDHG